MTCKNFIKGKKCKILSYEKLEDSNTRLTVEVPASIASGSDYYGNRGINLITEYVYTPFASLQTAMASTNAVSTQTDRIYYNTSTNLDITLWMKGYLVPGKSSIYEFEVVTNGEAILMLSTDSKSINKVLKLHFKLVF